jgi:hypothetical protein
MLVLNGIPLFILMWMQHLLKKGINMSGKYNDNFDFVLRCAVIGGSGAILGKQLFDLPGAIIGCIIGCYLAKKYYKHK